MPVSYTAPPRAQTEDPIGSGTFRAATDGEPADRADDLAQAMATTATILNAAETKLAGIAEGATANATNSQLRDRATHTGTQTAATISDFAAAVRTVAPTRRTVTAAATIATTDDVLRVNSAGAVTITVPSNLTATVTVVQVGGGQVTLAAGTGASFTAGLPLKSSGQGQGLTVDPQGGGVYDVYGGVA